MKVHVFQILFHFLLPCTLSLWLGSVTHFFTPSCKFTLLILSPAFLYLADTLLLTDFLHLPPPLPWITAHPPLPALSLPSSLKHLQGLRLAASTTSAASAGLRAPQKPSPPPQPRAPCAPSTGLLAPQQPLPPPRAPSTASLSSPCPLLRLAFSPETSTTSPVWNYSGGR